MNKSPAFLLLACVVWVLHGCGSTGSTPPPPVVATHFSVTPSTSSPTGGTAFSVTVTALSVSGQTAIGYSGTVHFTSTDSQAILPAASTLSNGVGTFSVTLKTSGNQTITAMDTASLAGTSSAITVGGSAATHFSVVAPSYAATAGTPINIVVTAIDVNGNTVTGYSGTVHFTSSDGKAVLPANSPLTTGVGNFSATLNTSGSETIVATDSVSSSITGMSNTFQVSGPTTHFSVANVASSAATRSPVTLFVVALDASNNESTAYTGMVRITSSDKNAILPANGPLHSGDGNFQITLETAGSPTVTATDTVASSITGTAAIAVTASTPLAITSGTPPPGTVASPYGPTSAEYLRCTTFPLQGCTPCVPNTAAGCGASLPFCQRQGFARVCIRKDVFVGFELTGAGGVPPYKWTSSSLPQGLAISTDTRRVLISGTPTPGTAATYNATVTLNDSGSPPAPTTATYSIVISNPPPPVVSSTSLFPGATVNQTFGYTFSATGGLPPYQNWKETGTLPAGIAPLTSAGVLAGTPTVTGMFPISVTVDDSLGQVSAALGFNLRVYAHGFRATGAMGTARSQQTATLLADGTVLVAGGVGLDSAEKYDPSTGRFTATIGSMSVARLGHTATLLTDGKVLITGGQTTIGATPSSTAELFDPSTGKFTPTTGNMNSGRFQHTATLQSDGTVLITGGFDGSTFLATAEIFDPSTGKFTLTTGKLGTVRANHTATLLTNGKVLIAGGFTGSAALASAELYDSATGSFSATGNMTMARAGQTATLLSAGTNVGKALVAGGSTLSAIAELYDATTGNFSATGAMETSATGTATLLGDGTVLMEGGQDPSSGFEVTLAELYDPNGGTFAGTGALQTAREAHTATLLKDGTVLVTGGVNTNGILASAEVYQ
jgi:hypothetical protein